MKKTFLRSKVMLYSCAIALLLVFQGRALDTDPLTLVQTIEMPNVPTFPYADHLGVDVKGHRLFAAMQGAKSEVVIDINAAKVIHNIQLQDPHSVVYRSDLDRIYVTDGDPTEPGVKVFDGRDYHLIKSIKLQQRTDSAAYDPKSKYFYVVNGGEAAKQNYSLISVVDTTSMESLGDIKIPGETLEQLELEASGPRLYVTIEEKSEIAVVDREKRALLETWPITKGKVPAAIALDEANHRLFVGCRTTDMHGHIVVFDTTTGKEIDALPIGGHVDQMFFDPASKRIYASDGVGVDVYQEQDPDHYALLGKADTGLMSKTGLLVPELHRYFAAVPHIGSQAAKILVFQTQ
jgi:DNA-binding beta-propeller fold protein YncE